MTRNNYKVAGFFAPCQERYWVIAGCAARSQEGPVGVDTISERLHKNEPLERLHVPEKRGTTVVVDFEGGAANETWGPTNVT